jgi:hypothetical protein
MSKYDNLVEQQIELNSKELYARCLVENITTMTPGKVVNNSTVKDSGYTNKASFTLRCARHDNYGFIHISDYLTDEEFEVIRSYVRIAHERIKAKLDTISTQLEAVETLLSDK